MIREAAAFAAKAHEGAFRKGSGIPYIIHPMEVALLVAQMTRDEEIIAAAYLHDVLEDTPVTAAELKERFGPRVLALVQKESEDKSLSWRERKAHTIEQLRGADPDEKYIALADKVSNLRATARDYLVIGDRVWERFHEKNRDSHQWYYRGLLESLSDMNALPAYQELGRLYALVFGEEPPAGPCGG